MAIAEDEPSVGKADARSGQWVDITMKKDYLKRYIWYPDSGCSRRMTVVKQYLHKYSKEPGPKVVFGDDSLGDTKGYGSVKCNGITFTRVAYVNGLKHNLISISQLCDANFKVLFIKTRGTILNQNDEVVLIALRRRDVYIIDIKMKNLNEVRVKELRSDNGTEFKNHKLEEFYDEKAAKTMLNSAKLHKQFWGEAVNTACYTQNRYIIVKRHRKTAYDVFRGRSPYISLFHVFGCLIHIYNRKDHLGKFDEKVDDGFFLGYSPVAKAFRVFNIKRQEMEETVHVTFSEDDEAISQSSTEGDAINFNENRSFPDDEFLEPRIPQYGWSREKHNELVNIIGEPLAGITTRSRIWKNKMDENGVAIKNKARLVTQADMGFMVYQMDVKSEFFNRKLSEEVYVQQPPGFETSEFPNHVCKLDKALYGLKQAPRAWYETLSKFRIQHKFIIGSGFYLKVYSDSDYAGCNLDRKSTSRACQILGGKLVCWSAKKQSSMAMSSAKAEYVTAVRCCTQVFWIKSQLADYDVLYDKVPIFCDNTSAIAISNNPILHSRTKHIDIMYHFIRNHILKGDIELRFVPTDLQLADIFTKPLAEPSFTRLVTELGMLNIQKQVSDKKKALSDL
ncbi:retrovirus-related pol polyprotein from transposon TNT 1-94 [Tanacetum coccineum]